MTLCPLSMDGEVGVIAPATNPETTVTVLPTEHWDAGEKAESIALYEKVEVKVGEATYVDELAPVIDVPHVPSEYHWYDIGGVPPEAWVVRVTDWPLSMVGLDGVIGSTTRAELTATVSPPEHCELAGFPCDASPSLYA